MLNRVVIVGRLTRDPDLRYTPNGIAVANFNVAANRPYKNQQGEQEADFINCVIWRKPAENLATYMKKGSLIGVEGRIQTRSYENQEGKMVYVTEVLADNVQFLESRNSSQQRGQDGGFGGQDYGHQQEPSGYGQGQQQSTQSSNRPFENDGQQIDISDDDLPF
ncbi:MAG TPA: single-stranded DNA-binding protein [Pseudogracilibacillus sp.]|nr:single-stranded DNA-binding protein [Pseudogracilibacillus sp.]